MPLNPTPAYAALDLLMRGVNQKQLWRLLITDLHERISSELLLQVSKIRSNVRAGAEADIQVTGVTNRSEHSAFDLTFGSKDQPTGTAAVGLDWDWTGRLWQCWDAEYAISLRLELEVDGNGLRFRFHPRALEDVLLRAREELSLKLQEELGANGVVLLGQRLS